jgi:hypothetical protein
MEPCKARFAVLRFGAECAVSGAECSVNIVLVCVATHDNVHGQLINVNLGSVAVSYG